MRLPQPGDFVLTSLGHGFIKERRGSIYLVKHGDCQFAFRPDEIKILQTREDRQKNGPLNSKKLKKSQANFFKA